MKKVCLQACVWALAVPLMFFSQGAGAVVVTQSFALGDNVSPLAGGGAVNVDLSIPARTINFGSLLAAVGGTGGTLTISTGVCGGLGFHVDGIGSNTFDNCNNPTNYGIDIGSDSGGGANDDNLPSSLPASAVEWFGVSLDGNSYGQFNCFGQDGFTAITGCAPNSYDPVGTGSGNQNYEFSLALAIDAGDLSALLTDGEIDVILDFAAAVAHANEGDILDLTLEYTAVPIPAALPLFASGLIGLGFVARRKKKAA